MATDKKEPTAKETTSKAAPAVKPAPKAEVKPAPKAEAKPAAKPTAKPATKPTTPAKTQGAAPKTASKPNRAPTSKSAKPADGKVVKKAKVTKISKIKETRPHAIAKYIRMSSSKVSIVMDLIRGKSYAEASSILQNLPNSAAEAILKTLNSAAANGENNMGLSKDEMYVAEIYATQGPTMKRLNIRARGRVDRILKRSCHIYVVLDTKAV